jgi:hypothetical protein
MKISHHDEMQINSRHRSTQVVPGLLIRNKLTYAEQMETNQVMVEIQDMPQTWWEIECTYDGTLGSSALSAGDTAEQAEVNFRRSLMYPELAIEIRLNRIDRCHAGELLRAKLKSWDA